MRTVDERRAPRRLLAALALLAPLALAGCEEEAIEEEAEEVVELTHREPLDDEEAVDVTEPGEMQDVPPVPSAGVGGEVCMRARLCCEEFVTTMAAHSDEVEASEATDCTQVVPEGAEDPENVCQDAIRGWAEALRGANVEVPSHCVITGPDAEDT